MTDRTKRALAYWLPTGLVALNWGFGGASSLLGSPASVEVYTRLGYPHYFAFVLGAAQVLGVVALLAPVPRTLREWAYAGLTFDAIAATISLLVIGTPWMLIGFPVIAGVLVLLSHRAWHKRLETTASN